MNLKRSQYKLPLIKNTQNKNEADLDTKTADTLISAPLSEWTGVYKPIYDSGWNDVVPKDINEATTQVENLELPQKINFEATFNLEIPEAYLPFVDYQILTKPVDNQKVQGTGKFTYQKLNEVVIRVYQWIGSTQHSSGLSPSASVYDDGTTLPPIPAITLTPLQPSGCYTSETFYTDMHVAVGTGLTYSLTKDGLYIDNGSFTTRESVIAGLIAIWNPGGYVNITYDFGQSITFNYLDNVYDLPVPDDGQSTVPCGGTTPAGPGVGYWLWYDTVLFSEYMSNYGHTYAQATAIFTQFYPEIFITPFSHGAPYKAYTRVTSNVVETTRKLMQITKIDDKNFKFDISGYLLLVTPSTEEVYWSDPDFPTYHPTGAALSLRVVVFFRGHPVNFIKTKEFDNELK